MYFICIGLFSAATATPNPSPSEPGDDVPLSPTTGGSLSQDSALTETDSSVNLCQSPPEKFAALVPSDCGLPLEIFTKVSITVVCLLYKVINARF